MDNLNYSQGDTVYDFIQYMIWSIIGVLLLASVSGLASVFLKSKLKGDVSELEVEN